MSQAPIQSIAVNNALTSTRNVKHLTADEEAELFRRWRSDDDLRARDGILLAHKSLALQAARRYTRGPVEFDDLLQEGLVGLHRAAEKFDATLGLRFSTYAVHWVRTYVSEYVNHNTYAVRRISKNMETRLYRALYEMERKAGPVHRTEEFARRLAATTGMNIATVYGFLGGLSGDVSTEQPAKSGTDNNGLMLGETFRCESPTPEDALCDAEEESFNSERISEAMRVLNERERYIVEARCLRLGDEAATLKDMGEHFGITRERVRQIETVALKKMRRALLAQDARVQEIARARRGTLARRPKAAAPVPLWASA